MPYLRLAGPRSSQPAMLPVRESPPTIQPGRRLHICAQPTPDLRLVPAPPDTSRRIPLCSSSLMASRSWLGPFRAEALLPQLAKPQPGACVALPDRIVFDAQPLADLL